MRVNIAYSGISKKYLEGIKGYLTEKDSVFIPLGKENRDDVLLNGKSDALLIGEEIPNPIRLAQEAYSADSSLSILIISEPSHFKSIKQALLFTPFIGSSVNCIADGDEKTLALTVNNLITKTQQRRNFEALKKVPIPVHASPRIEQLKREYINKFFEKAPVGAILLDNDGGIIGLNNQASEVLNVQEKELLGSKLYNFFPENIKQKLKLFLDHGYKELSKQSFIKAQLPERHIEISISEVKVEVGFKYKIAIIDDITEKLIKDRQIQSQLEELKKINTDLDNFIYTASHDLKAPISNIEGLIYALREITLSKKDLEEQLQVMDLIEKSILRFKATIQDLADIAKVQRNTEEEVVSVNIKEAVLEVLESLDKEIKSTDTHIELSFNNCAIVNLSKSNFKSIILNLVSNAIKYHSPNRRPFVKISCEEIQGFVKIEVEDNGLGVSKNNLAKMFTMFRRFHDHVEGTGIGLYIVKRILDNAGGKIEVDSEVGKGTIFKVYIKI